MYSPWSFCWSFPLQILTLYITRYMVMEQMGLAGNLEHAVCTEEWRDLRIAWGINWSLLSLFTNCDSSKCATQSLLFLCSYCSVNCPDVLHTVFNHLLHLDYIIENTHNQHDKAQPSTLYCGPSLSEYDHTAGTK